MSKTPMATRWYSTSRLNFRFLNMVKSEIDNWTSSFKRERNRSLTTRLNSLQVSPLEDSNEKFGSSSKIQIKIVVSPQNPENTGFWLKKPFPYQTLYPGGRLNWSQTLNPCICSIICSLRLWKRAGKSEGSRRASFIRTREGREGKGKRFFLLFQERGKELGRKRKWKMKGINNWVMPTVLKG